MPTRSSTHLLLIPTYNAGVQLRPTVTGALHAWNPVWVVVDGSDDGSDNDLESLARPGQELRVIRLPRNRGKGSAVLHGIELALEQGFTHVLTMDSDGQHPASEIGRFMDRSMKNPGSMVLGKPVFDHSAPTERVLGRRLANGCCSIVSMGGGIGDCLFGFRVYPLKPMHSAMLETRWARRFDFDPEVAVRMSWKGVPSINEPCPVRYFKPGQGGVSHFNYLRDNVLLTSMFLRLFVGSLSRLPRLLRKDRWAT